ncbi:facilitated trehalose transporter Tret1 [Microplitis demolitor]|uniref:facilitated trehalose transporter Tret1 n=1 Tax=Microplitis demolitor TaxID=69319 RepID=UPI0004CD0165|nr:facilitated trehalose transporter Tret1 [Microplitis demolitor]
MQDQARYWWKLIYIADAKGIIAGLAAHSGQISVGLSQGFSAILVPKLVKSNFASINEASWVASLGVISNPLGAFIAGITAECIGRRTAIALATLPHVTGWLLIAFAHDVPTLYAGRFIGGIGTGMANALYLYVTEAAAPHQRAWLASAGPILVSFGVLGIYALGALTTWHSSAAISIIPAIISLALTRVIPESPAWLVRKNRLDEAKQALIWLRGPGLVCEHEYKELCTSNVQQLTIKSENLTKVIKNIWRPFIILFIFFALQQLCGIYIILFYAVNFLKDIGTDIDEYVASVGVGVIRLAAAILGAGLANHFGRKSLACTSALGMALSSGGIAVAIKYHVVPTWIPLLCIALHVAFSMIGYLTLPWVMTSELYPLKYRSTAGGLTTAIAQIMTFAAIKSYPHVNTTIGVQPTLYIFTIAALLGALFASTILPETKGKSLDEIGKGLSAPKVKNNCNLIVNDRFSMLPDDKYVIYPNDIVVPKEYNNLGMDLSDEKDVVLRSEVGNNQENFRDRGVLKISTLEHGYI